MSEYSVTHKSVENRPGTWRSLEVDVLKDGEILSTYIRNYPSFFDTFCVFKQDDHDYALISVNYGQVSVMDLETGDIIAEREPGFCPTEFWHPDSDTPDDPWGPEYYNGEWALVAGCHWGDDSSRKVEYLDLTKIIEGIVTQEQRYGYIELGAKMAKNVDYYPPESTIPGWLRLPVLSRVNVSGGRPMLHSDYDVHKSNQLETDDE